MDKLLGLVSPARAYTLAGFVAVVLLAFLLGRCSGAHSERQKADAHAAEARAQAYAKQAHAVEQAATQRASDNATITQRQEARSHADDAVPDSAPSPARNALSCQRLREQAAAGRAKLPLECGPTG